MNASGAHGTWLRSPAATTVVLALLGLVVFAALLLFTELNAADQSFVDSVWFRAWIAMVTLSVGVWVALFFQGVATIRRLSQSSPTWKRERTWWMLNVAAYVAFLLVAMTLMTLLRVRLGVPVHGWTSLIRALTVVGALGGGPWVLLAWLAHEQVRRLAADVQQIEPVDPIDEGAAKPPSRPKIESAVADTLTAWTVIERCALALALLVSTTVFNTGALRVALIDFGVDESRFPPSFVVGLGAFFAVLLAAAIAPLVLGWRSHAVNLVDRVLSSPKGGIPSQTWLDARTRLEARLGLNIRVFRNPITTLSLLSPFVTALVTAFIPNLS